LVLIGEYLHKPEGESLFCAKWFEKHAHHKCIGITDGTQSDQQLHAREDEVPPNE
jgi:hypothetical protein